MLESWRKSRGEGVGEKRNAYQVGGRKTRGIETYWDDLEVDRRIILKWVLRECDGKMWTEFLYRRTVFSDELPGKIHSNHRVA
jgi:hypothetical protein